MMEIRETAEAAAYLRKLADEIDATGTRAIIVGEMIENGERHVELFGADPSDLELLASGAFLRMRPELS